MESVPNVVPRTRTSRRRPRCRSKLKKALNRFHLIFFLVSTIVILDTVGAVADNGAQAFTWLVFLALLFFVPFGLLTAELGSAFPQEGGPYLWPRLAFGRVVGGLNTVVYWASNPIWIGGSLTIVAISVYRDFFGSLKAPGQYLFGLAFIWLVVLFAILSLRAGKWVPTIGAWARAALLGFFTVTVGIYAAKPRNPRRPDRRFPANMGDFHRRRAAAGFQLRGVRTAELGR